MTMDRAIFDLQLDIDSTSLYILACALVDQGETPTLDRMRQQWNGSPENLAKAAQELIARGILVVEPPLTEDKPLSINPREKWQPN